MEARPVLVSRNLRLIAIVVGILGVVSIATPVTASQASNQLSACGNDSPHLRDDDIVPIPLDWSGGSFQTGNADARGLAADSARAQFVRNIVGLRDVPLRKSEDVTALFADGIIQRFVIGRSPATLSNFAFGAACKLNSTQLQEVELSLEQLQTLPLNRFDSSNFYDRLNARFQAVTRTFGSIRYTSIKITITEERRGSRDEPGREIH